MSVFIILSEITFEIILNFLRRNLHLYSVGYEKFNIMRDCNPEVTEISMNILTNTPNSSPYSGVDWPLQFS